MDGDWKTRSVPIDTSATPVQGIQLDAPPPEPSTQAESTQPFLASTDPVSNPAPSGTSDWKSRSVAVTPPTSAVTPPQALAQPSPTAAPETAPLPPASTQEPVNDVGDFGIEGGKQAGADRLAAAEDAMRAKNPAAWNQPDQPLSTGGQAVSSLQKGVYSGLTSAVSGGADLVSQGVTKAGFTAPDLGVHDGAAILKSLVADTYPKVDDTTLNHVMGMAGSFAPALLLPEVAPFYMAAVGADQKRDQINAETPNAPQDQKDLNVALSGAVNGALGLIPGLGLVKSFGAEAMTGIAGLAARTFISGAAGAGVGGLVQAMNNAIDQYTTNPGKKIYDGTGKSALETGLMAMLLHGMTEVSRAPQPTQTGTDEPFSAGGQPQITTPPAAPPPEGGSPGLLSRLRTLMPGQADTIMQPEAAARPNKLDLADMLDSPKTAGELAADQAAAQAAPQQLQLGLRPTTPPVPEIVPNLGNVRVNPLKAQMQQLSSDGLMNVITTSKNRRMREAAQAEYTERFPDHVDDDLKNVEITTAAQAVNTNPTEGQKEAGNYQKGHVWVGGLPISIENPQGSVRSGTSPEGAWSVTMPAHYGYIKATDGADGDHMDVYISPNVKYSKSSNPKLYGAQRVYVVDQVDPKTGIFDEHKALIGFDNHDEAMTAYKAAFSDGAGTARLGALTEMSMPKFKQWLKNGDTTKPLSYKQAPVEVAPKPEKVAPPAAPVAPAPDLKALGAHLSAEPAFTGAPVKGQPRVVVAAGPETPKLPRMLAGAKPRYNYGDKPFELKFDSDIDKALYIVAQKTTSRRDADYRGFLKNHGYTDASINSEAPKVRSHIKAMAADAEPGILRILPISQHKELNNEGGQDVKEHNEPITQGSIQQEPEQPESNTIKAEDGQKPAVKPQNSKSAKPTSEKRNETAVKEKEVTPELPKVIDEHLKNASEQLKIAVENQKQPSPVKRTKAPEKKPASENEVGLPDPVTMSDQGLFRTQKKVESAFADDNGKPAADRMTDEQFNALEDYARTLEEEVAKRKSQGGMQPFAKAGKGEASLHKDLAFKTPEGWNTLTSELTYTKPPVPKGEIRVNRQEATDVTPKQQELIDAVNGEIKRLAPGATPQVFASIKGETTSGSFKASGIYNPRYGGVSHVIMWTLDGSDPMGIGRHETIHYFKASGLITKPEWKALEKTSVDRDWLKKHNIAENYRDFDHEVQLEESVAYEFSDWKKGLEDKYGKLPGRVQRTFQKMDLFKRRTAAAIRKTFGKEPTADDVFTRIDTGEVGARPERRVSRQPQRFAKSEPVESDAFKKWFGDSKVVDDEGNPLVVYHGTISDFHTFDEAKRPEENEGDLSSLGIWFSNKPKVAGIFADINKEAGSNIMPAYLSIDKMYKASRGEIEALRDHSGYDDFRQDLQDRGYDGISIPGPHRSTSYVAFSPTQIKSVFNSGEFSLSNPDIRFAKAGAPKPPPKQEDPADIKRPFDQRLAELRKRLKKAPTPYEYMRELTKEVGTSLPDKVSNFMDSTLRDTALGVNPMSQGSIESRALAKDYMNSVRLADWRYSEMFEKLTENFKPDDLKNMWEKMDETSVWAQKQQAKSKEPLSFDDLAKKAESAGAGIYSLPKSQREIILALNNAATKLYDQAKDLEMVQGDGIPFWTPRMAVRIAEDGTINTPGSANGEKPTVDSKGMNFSTYSANLKQRKHLEAGDTEAAMQAKFGDDSKLVRDIRVMPLAMRRLERAVAGRAFINRIKSMSSRLGYKTVRNTEADGFFTLDHPAFKDFRPRMTTVAGKVTPTMDQNGKMVFDKHNIYVSKEFEGPLKAIMMSKQPLWYRALMGIKMRTIGLIMYSPLMHNAVEWGRAMPAAPGKVASLKIYFEGNAARQGITYTGIKDHIQGKNKGNHLPEHPMVEAVKNGMVPIGGRGFKQDITSIAEEPNLIPGRSITAKALGYSAEMMALMFGRSRYDTGNKVRQAVDKAGDFYHNTLLWQRVADLQMGLYMHLRDQLLKDGFDKDTAGKMAAHFANRYAGALPIEAMSEAARRLANVMMFSRTFTMGNLGVMKDVLSGLPSDVASQIERNSGVDAARAAKTKGAQKAFKILALDIGLMRVGNILLAAGLGLMLLDDHLDHILKGYASRLSRLMNHLEDDPLDLIPEIVSGFESLDPTFDNEPGKVNRIMLTKDDKGTAYYARFPTGKVGEEFTKWLTDPRHTALAKMSPLVKGIEEDVNNRDNFGRKILDDQAKGFTAGLENIGKAVEHILAGQQGLTEIVKGADSLYQDEKTGTGSVLADSMKTFGPMVGITVSKGYPGGPAVGEQNAVLAKRNDAIDAARPDIKEMVERGDVDGAIDKMVDLGMTKGDIKHTIKIYEVPETRISKSAQRKFEDAATDEEQERFDRAKEGNGGH